MAANDQFNTLKSEIPSRSAGPVGTTRAPARPMLAQIAQKSSPRPVGLFWRGEVGRSAIVTLPADAATAFPATAAISQLLEFPAKRSTMDVAERKHELTHQREQRQRRDLQPVRPEPLHWRTRLVPLGSQPNKFCSIIEPLALMRVTGRVMPSPPRRTCRAASRRSAVDPNKRTPVGPRPFVTKNAELAVRTCSSGRGDPMTPPCCSMWDSPPRTQPRAGTRLRSHR